MNSKNKNFLWAIFMMIFYIAIAFMGIYGISLMYLWPFLAVPMSIYILKTGNIEIGALIGVVLSVIVSLIETGTFDPVIVISFLLFIVLPSLVFGKLYNKAVKIPWIIAITTVSVFLSAIILIVFSKFLGIDYISMYFDALDKLKLIMRENLINNAGEAVDQSMEGLNSQTIANMILVAKRTYPSMLFIFSLIGSTLHLFIVQIIALIRSWERPRMKEILNTGLSSIAVWSLMILMLVSYQVGDDATTLVFVVENMMNIILSLFQIIGVISFITFLGRLKTKKIFKVLLIALGLVWLFINPVILVIIGCVDSIFNLRKAETLI